MALQQKLPLSISRFISVLMVMAIGSSVEIMQYFGIHVFGSTYDPLDFVMYILGVLLGWLIDISILRNYRIQL
jgi:hypothetical protein